MGIDGVLSILFTFGALVISIVNAATSVRKGRVDHLGEIVEAQTIYIDSLKCQLADALARNKDYGARIHSLETALKEAQEELERTKARMVVLERENRWYLHILLQEGIDPGEYCEEREGNGG